MTKFHELPEQPTYSSYSTALVERASYLWCVLGETVSLMRLPAKWTHMTSAQGPISILLYKRTKSTSPFYISRNFRVFGLFACSAGLFLHICELFFPLIMPRKNIRVVVFQVPYRKKLGSVGGQNFFINFLLYHFHTEILRLVPIIAR